MRQLFIRQPLCTLCLFLGLSIFLAACTSTGGSGTSNASATPGSQPTTPAGIGRVTPSPGVGLGPQPCPDAVKDPAHWDPLIPTQVNVSSVHTVSCGYLKGVPVLQALVTVLYQGTGHILDVYVFDDITAGKPVQVFRLQNLSRGDARISLYNTVLTAEVDQSSSQNTGKPAAELVPDLFREFKWSDQAGTLVQISFPGIFPDLTRYQAEGDQQQVNQGHQPWKLRATMTAQAFGASLLHWDPAALATLTSGGGNHDAQATVNLKNTSAGGTVVTLALARLEGNTNGGIWIVITVTSGAGLSITEPRPASVIHRSVPVSGTGNAFEGVIGSVTILDHLYTDIGHAQAHGVLGNGMTTFSAVVTCQPTFKTGAQEGLVMLTSENTAAGGVAGAVIVKVLIQM
jgi:hypothetical protein